MILLKNGRIIKNNKLINKDVLIKDGIIYKIGDNLTFDCETIDVNNALIMMGAVDVHVHLREPGFEYKETIKTGTLSAAKGGVTTIMSMPNLKPCPDNINALNVQLDKIQKDACVHVYPYGSVTINEEDKEISDIKSIKDKVLAITDDGRGVNNIEVLKQAMILAKKYDLVIASHAEDKVDGYKPQGEYVAVRREIELAKEIGCRYHFCHMSTKESFEAIRKAHKEGYNNITCEVSPHHLVLNETMIKDGNWKMNPPLRSELNRQETIKALIDGTACMIASDHAPHSIEEKTKKDYMSNLNGIIGLETMVPIIYTYFVKTGLISWNKFEDILVNNPRRVFKMPSLKFEEGYPADIAVIDIDNEHIYEESEILSMGKNSPFIGQKLYGFAKFTFVDGKLVYKKGEEINV